MTQLYPTTHLNTTFSFLCPSPLTFSSSSPPLPLHLVQLWREFWDCNHVPTWVQMTVTLPDDLASFRADSFREAIGTAVFEGGPENDIARMRVKVIPLPTFPPDPTLTTLTIPCNYQHLWLGSCSQLPRREVYALRRSTFVMLYSSSHFQQTRSPIFGSWSCTQKQPPASRRTQHISVELTHILRISINSSGSDGHKCHFSCDGSRLPPSQHGVTKVFRCTGTRGQEGVHLS